MRNAAKFLMLGLGGAALGALAACHKTQPQQNQSIDIDQNMPTSEVPGNADIETLPPDESSTTPSNQLQNGYDNPDVNDLGNSH
jgi:hypothetical protein